MAGKKRPTPKKTIVVQNTTPREIQSEAQNMIRNGLSEAILGFNPGSSGTQLSQVDTIFKNQRWYLISNMRQVLSQFYVEHGLVQTIVDVPVEDGLRGGVEIKSKTLSPEEIEQLQVAIEREDIIAGVVGQALKWNRLYGGAGVIIMTDQPPEEPLNIDLITEDSPLEFRPVDMWELFYDKQNTEGYNPELQATEFQHYNYYAKKLHKSRVLKMKGITAPSFIRPRLRGWGFSVIESLVFSINQYLKENNLSFEVLDEFKLDIYKIKNLTGSLLSADGQAAIQKRVAIANQQKSFQNAITMDAEDDYLQKQLSFAGLADVMKEIRMQIACDMRMPLTKIFGISAAGFSSGEDDIENYNSMVESQVRAKSKFDILRIVEIMCKKKFGQIPDDLTVTFKPMRILSAEQEENVKTQKFNRVLAAKQAGEIDSKEFRDACNKDNLLSVQLDTEKEVLTDDEDDGEEEDTKDSGGTAKKPSTQPKKAPEAKT